MNETTYSKYQNFNGEIDQVQEAKKIAALLGFGNDKYIENEYHLAYRLMLQEGEDITAENLESMYDCIYSMIVFNYYTDDIKAIEENPIDYLSTNYDDLYTEDGHEYDEETGEKLESKLQFDKNYSYVINRWTYEIR